MKHIRTLLLAVLLIFGAALPDAALGQESPLRFLHLLQENNYGDMAVEYLKLLQEQPETTQNVRDVWDLEMSKSLLAASTDAFDARESEQLLQESRTYLEKFIAEKPDHPEWLAAIVLQSDVEVKRALQLIRNATTSGDKEKQAGRLQEARTTLEEMQARFQQATAKFKAQLAALPPKGKGAPRNDAHQTRETVEFNVSEATFQTALLGYYLAQTYLESQLPERKQALEHAAAEFDAIYQANRRNISGIYAHMWHGKTMEELGDLQTALDIYDEVLANAPDPNEKNGNAKLEPLFTQVELFRLLILAKKKPAQFLAEANEWLKSYQRLKPSDGYQSIALEVAKTQFTLAQQASGPERTKRLNEVLKLATEMTRVRSSCQQEFLLLRRDILKANGREKNEATSFDEAVALGDAAAAGQEWDIALANYNTALQLAEAKDAARTDAVRHSMNGVQLAVARELLNAGKLSACLTAAESLAHDSKEASVAAPAAALAVNAALNLYAAAAAADKPKALEQLNRVAEFTEQTWPDRPEADDARMARGMAKLFVGQVDEAINVFDRVNPKSERYAVAQFFAGQNYWHRYLVEKAKPEDARKTDQMTADRATTLERLTTSLNAFKRQPGAGWIMPRHQSEAQLLLAEVYSEGDEARKAAALYQPLVDAVQADKPQTFDNTTARIFLGAVRAYTALNDLDKASHVGTVLLDLGPDTLPVNHVLLEFASLLNAERKKADAQVTRLANQSNLAEIEAATHKLASLQKLLQNVLKKLAARKEMSLAGMTFVGDTLEVVGLTTEANQEYRQILERAKTDAEFAKAATTGTARVRMHLIQALRQGGRYEEALQQVDTLIAENPRVLEAYMEKGRILEAWAEQEPSRYQDAVAHWTDLRVRLQQIRGKKPPEYYEVMYRVADCLVHDAQQMADRQEAITRAKQAEQVLKSALILSPTLDGPDTVARYEALLKRALAMQKP